MCRCTCVVQRQRSKLRQMNVCLNVWYHLSSHLCKSQLRSLICILTRSFIELHSLTWEIHWHEYRGQSSLVFAVRVCQHFMHQCVALPFSTDHLIGDSLHTLLYTKHTYIRIWPSRKIAFRENSYIFFVTLQILPLTSMSHCNHKLSRHTVYYIWQKWVRVHFLQVDVGWA